MDVPADGRCRRRGPSASRATGTRWDGGTTCSPTPSSPPEPVTGRSSSGPCSAAAGPCRCAWAPASSGTATPATSSTCSADIGFDPERSRSRACRPRAGPGDAGACRVRVGNLGGCRSRISPVTGPSSPGVAPYPPSPGADAPARPAERPADPVLPRAGDPAELDVRAVARRPRVPGGLRRRARASTLVDQYKCYELWEQVGQLTHVPGTSSRWASGVAAPASSWPVASSSSALTPGSICATRSRASPRPATNDPWYRGGEHSDTSPRSSRSWRAKVGVEVDAARRHVPRRDRSSGRGRRASAGAHRRRRL